MARLAVSVGVSPANGISPSFISALDVTCGGVLLALPALLAVGLLRHTDDHFELPNGYYSLSSIFLLLAFLSLGRITSLEQLRYEPPGEWGKLLGLDRIPEVRTLRDKIKHLAEHGQPVPWSAALCRDWMEAAPEQAQACYIDGHIRVYHGEQTKLAKHYVSRQRLCLRATADYWVNAMDGQPFFVVTQSIDPGLIKVLEEQIIPRLSEDIPGQPTTSQLAADQLQHRFMVIFDREGYSPALMDRLWQQRIAALTYRKRPGEDWPHTEFSSHEVLLVGGETVTMQLAERGVHLGGIIWVREIRRLTTSGHQTAIVTTWYNGSLPRIAATMFARWCQENFFAYMRNHYGLDKLIGYGTESVPDTTPVINPAYRSIDGEIRRKRSTLQRLAAQFGGIGLEGEITPDKVSAYEVRKAALQEEIASLDQELASLKTKRKTVKRHITFAELPEEARFQRLTVHNKHMIDTIKMVSYRAETAMSHILTEKMARTDDARALLRSIYTKEADLMPDEEKGTLTVRLHNMTNRAHDAAVAHLCAELNATETSYPGTNLRLIYELVSSKNTGDQEF
jgi:predicted  nucleic acid-binding Zn-ribbon protein